MIAWFLCSAALHAQTPGPLRSRTFSVTQDSILLDTAVIFRGSALISDGEKVYTENKDYKIDYLHSLLIPYAIPRNTLLHAEYKVMQLQLAKPYRHKDRNMIQQEFRQTKNPFLYTPGNSGDGALFRSDGLKMNGSLSRGLAFGNNQNVVLNSNLNLQLAGKINNDVDVLAAISDDNNPIQPEGNTQQLQDFDKVYIQLTRDRTRLTVGDFEMVRPANSYFMNYYKKSRGGQLTTAFNTGKRGELRFGADGAVSRGRFARNVINGIEGNQGPYRLSGINGETFLIIISGTEAVYLDGERLTRGEQNDYIIDYNSGEVTFMPRRVITQYSRIIIEFQYSDRNYSRAVFHLNTEYEQRDAYRIRANYFMEQDNKSQPLLQNLNDTGKAILAAVGDNLDQALAPSESRTTTFSKNRILYRKIDTAGYNGIYVYTDNPNSDTVFFELKFSYVGEGKGNYVLAQSSANGRVFSWVAPVNGVLQGNYEPLTLLVSPKRMQMLTLGMDVLALKNSLISVEVARSDYDKNLFSRLDKSNDAGYGFKLSGTNTIPLEDKRENFWNLQTAASYEFVDQNFRYVERYRNVEFDRTWNRQLNNQQAQDTGYREHILYARTSLNKASIGNIFYQVGYYDRASAYNGFQSYAGTNLRFRRNMLNTEAEWLNTRDRSATQGITNEVRRYKIDYGRELFFLLAGARYETEQSNFRRADDTLLSGSFSYNQTTFYVRNIDSAAIRYNIDYSQREDFLPSNTEFSQVSTGRNLGTGITWMQQNGNRLSGSFTYRNFEVRDTAFTQLQPERTILSRIEYDYRFLKRVFSANTYYQLGSGNELRRDYQYVEVPVGQGIYVWKDFNGDDKQQLNEFVVASFIEKSQANFIRVFLATTSTIRTNSNQFNQTLNINPAAVWNNRKGWKKLVARWSNQTALKIDRKTTELNNADFVNPFLLNVRDSQLISLSSLVRNTLFFNRSDPTFGFDLNYQDSRTKLFQTNGFDSRHREEKGANARWNISSVWGLTAGYTFGTRAYYSDYFIINNYSYNFYEVRPRVIYQLSQNLRITGVFSYFEGVNRPEFGGQKGSSREYGAELRYNVSTSGVVNAKYSMYRVGFNGDNISSPVGYDMLNGFTVGQNSVWNISFQQRLGSNLQVNVSYDGRKSEGSNIIHIGRMEARYIF